MWVSSLVLYGAAKLIMTGNEDLEKRFKQAADQ
jgi:hypothetical protein